MLLTVQGEAIEAPAKAGLLCEAPSLQATEDFQVACRLMQLRLEATLHHVDMLQSAHASEVTVRQEATRKANDAEVQLERAHTKVRSVHE